jgi:hypothetical protein
MALTIPKQGVSGVARIHLVAATVGVPKQQVSANISAPAVATIAGSIPVPKQQFSGLLNNPANIGLSGVVGIPKQQVSASALVQSSVAIITIPMQQVTASVASNIVQTQITVPMQVFFGFEYRVDAPIAVPMQNVSAQAVQPILAIPIQQVTADLAVPLVLMGDVPIPMQAFPGLEMADMVGSMPPIQSNVSAMSGYWMDGGMQPLSGGMSVLTGVGASLSGSIPVIVSSISIDVPFSMHGIAGLMQSSIGVTAGSVASIEAQAFTTSSQIQVTLGCGASLAGVGLEGVGSAFDVAVFTVAAMDASVIAGLNSAVDVSVGPSASIDSMCPHGASSDLYAWLVPEIAMHGTLPSMTGQAQARALLQIQLAKIYALNLKVGGVTQIQSNVPIESVTAIDGVIYVAGPAGLFRLAGTTDAGGALIKQSAMFAAIDFGGNQKKYPESVLIEAHASNPPVLNVVANGASFAYLSSGPKRGTTYRAKVGRGIVHKRIQFGISGSNVESVESVDLVIGSGKRSF